MLLDLDHRFGKVVDQAHSQAVSQHAERPVELRSLFCLRSPLHDGEFKEQPITNPREEVVLYVLEFGRDFPAITEPGANEVAEDDLLLILWGRTIFVVGVDQVHLVLSIALPI